MVPNFGVVYINGDVPEIDARVIVVPISYIKNNSIVYYLAFLALLSLRITFF